MSTADTDGCARSKAKYTLIIAQMLLVTTFFALCNCVGTIIFHAISKFPESGSIHRLTYCSAQNSSTSVTLCESCLVARSSVSAKKRLNYSDSINAGLYVRSIMFQNMNSQYGLDDCHGTRWAVLQQSRSEITN
jgi:hypothetical protein